MYTIKLQIHVATKLPTWPANGHLRERSKRRNFVMMEQSGSEINNEGPVKCEYQYIQFNHILNPRAFPFNVSLIMGNYLSVAKIQLQTYSVHCSWLSRGKLHEVSNPNDVTVGKSQERSGVENVKATVEIELSDLS